MLSPDQDVARRFGVWECCPGHKRTLRAVQLADRARIITELALHFAPGIDISHVCAATASHAHAHPDLYEYVRLTPPALLVWLAREFHLAGEAFSSRCAMQNEAPLYLSQVAGLSLYSSGHRRAGSVGRTFSRFGRHKWQGFVKSGRNFPFGRICLTKQTFSM